MMKGTSIFRISTTFLSLVYHAQSQTIYQLASNAPDRLLTFATALELAGLDSSSYLNDNNGGPFTALAPDNEAFESISGRYLEPEWKNFLTALLEYHVLQGEILASSISRNMTLTSQFAGKEVKVSEIDPITFNENSMVVDGNLDASNGIVHVVNNLLLPENIEISLLDQAAANPNLSRFVELVQLLGFTDILNEEGPWTVLIPTNNAFDKIPRTILDQLDDNALSQIVLFHVLPEIQMAYQQKNISMAMTMQGESLQLSSTGIVGEADFTTKDILASNGVWHAIDTLLLPVVAPADAGTDANSEAPISTTTVATIAPTSLSPETAPDMEPSLNFWPTIQPHEAPSFSPSSRPPEASAADSPVSFSPAASSIEPSVSTTMTIGPTIAQTLSPTGTPGTIFSVAASVGTLSNFIDAVMLADLDGFLNSSGPFTVWAPMNDAFSGVPLKLYEPAWKLHLSALLKYHVISLHEVLTTDLAVGDMLPTAEGTEIEVTSVDPLILNGNARLITPDISTSNGLLNAINNLLLPPYVMNTVAQVVSTNDDLSELSMHFQNNAQLLSLLRSDEPVTLFAPVNTAFEKSPINAILGSLDDEGRDDILLYHIVPRVINSGYMDNGATYTTVQGTQLRIMSVDVMDESQFRVNDAAILKTDMLANNGIIHYIDTVLIPDLSTDSPTMVPTTNFPTILQSPTNSTETPTYSPATTPEAPTQAPYNASNTFMPTRNSNITEVGTPTVDNTTVAPTVKATASGSETLMSLAEIVNANEQFSVLAAAVNRSGLFGVLDSPQSILTVFAPSDAAFTASPLNLTQYLEEPEWRAHLISLITYNVLPGDRIESSQFTENMSTPTLEGNSIVVTSVNGGLITINSVPIETADLEASNGVIHVLDDQALLPPSATKDIVQVAASISRLSAVVALLEESELDLASGSSTYTFFAPTTSFLDALPSSMFAALGTAGLTEVLGFHVVPDRIYLEDDLAPGMELRTLQGSNIVIGSTNTSFNILSSNILGSNGVIHEIDNLLIPFVEDAGSPPSIDVQPKPSPTPSSRPSSAPSAISTTEIPSEDPTGASSALIVFPCISELLFADPNFDSLTQLLGTSGVDATLQTDGDFTVFAPNNVAVAEIPSFVLASLTEEGLVQTLSYHIVPGIFTAADLADGMVLPTLQGGNLTITVGTAGISLSDNGGTTAQVVRPEMRGSNGVIYEIDGFLLPILATDDPTGSPSLSPPTGTTETPTSLPDTSSGPTFDPTSTIMDVIAQNTELSNLAAILADTGLDAALSTIGPFTVFAPIDSAFQALPLGFLTNMTELQLTSLLSYHVVAGTFLSSELSEGMSLQTLSGTNLTIGSLPLPVNNASRWISVDLTASNGVVHMIGDVLVAALAPTQAPTLAPTSQPVAGAATGCDETMLAYAAVCCPVENPAFQSFCQVLFDRNQTKTP